MKIIRDITIAIFIAAVIAVWCLGMDWTYWAVYKTHGRSAASVAAITWFFSPVAFFCIRMRGKL